MKNWNKLFPKLFLSLLQFTFTVKLVQHSTLKTRGATACVWWVRVRFENMATFQIFTPICLLVKYFKQAPVFAILQMHACDLRPGLIWIIKEVITKCNVVNHKPAHLSSDSGHPGFIIYRKTTCPLLCHQISSLVWAGWTLIIRYNRDTESAYVHDNFTLSA